MTCAFRALRFLTLIAVPVLAMATLTPRAFAGQNGQQQSKSAPLATELTKLLDAQKLDSIAAPHDDAYVGALYFPGSQLLVVSARYSAPDRMKYLLAQKAYRDAYIDLNSATERASKVFVSDLGADGLRFRRERDHPFDSADVDGKSVSFDGDWGKARLSETEYTKQFQATDEQYAAMLQALIAALKKPS